MLVAYHNEWLLAGGIVFWLFAALAAVLLFLAVVNDSVAFGAVVAVVVAVVLRAAFEVNVAEYLPSTWLGWIVSVGSYVITGLAWSVFKFYVTYRKSIDHIADDKQTLIVRWTKDYPALTDAEIATKWSEYVDDRAPSVSGYKGPIFAWIVYWPLSIAIYVLGDLLADLFDSLYQWFSGVYERIAESLRNRIKM